MAKQNGQGHPAQAQEAVTRVSVRGLLQAQQRRSQLAKTCNSVTASLVHDSMNIPTGEGQRESHTVHRALLLDQVVVKS